MHETRLYDGCEDQKGGARSLSADGPREFLFSLKERRLRHGRRTAASKAIARILADGIGKQHHRSAATLVPLGKKVEERGGC